MTSSRIRTLLGVLLVGAIAVVATPVAAAADGHIYWGSYDNGSTIHGTTIGRAGLDGSNPDPNWVSGLSCTCAITYGNGYLWWRSGSTVSRVDPVTGQTTLPYHTPSHALVELTSGNGGFLAMKDSNPVGWYFYDLATQQTTGPIGINLTGLTRVGSQVYALASTGAYTTEVRRMDPSGGNVVALASVSRYSYASHLEVQGDWVYFAYQVTNGGQAYIGRARTDGSGAEATWITLDVGATSAWIASTPTQLFWMAYFADGSRKIYGMPIDGSAAPSLLISFPANSFAISSLAADPNGSDPTPSPSPSGDAATTPAPATTSAAATTKPTNAFSLHRESGTTTGPAIVTTVVLPGAGVITQRGVRVSHANRAAPRASNAACSVSKRIAKAGTYTLRCVVNAATARAQRSGAVNVVLRTTFTPTGGTARTTTRRITLQARPITGPNSVTG